MNLDRTKSGTEVAILLDDYVNKYHPGLQENSRALYKTTPTLPNLMNKDSSAIKLNEVQYSAVVQLQLPREVTRNYPKKYIPAGTRFIVQFISNDITKPQIIGMEQ